MPQRALSFEVPSQRVSKSPSDAITASNVIPAGHAQPRPGPLWASVFLSPCRVLFNSCRGLTNAPRCSRVHVHGVGLEFLCQSLVPGGQAREQITPAD